MVHGIIRLQPNIHSYQGQDCNNILADAISRLKTLDIYKELLDHPETSDTMTCIAEMVTIDVQTLSIDKLHSKQKKEIHCRNLAAQSYFKNRNRFNPVMISPDGLLQKHIHGLKYYVTIAPCSVVPLFPHEF